MFYYEDKHNVPEKHRALYHFHNFSMLAHMHKSYELLYLSQGKLSADVNGRTYMLTAGDMILILPYEIHAYKDEGHSVCDIVVFSPDYIQEFYNQTQNSALDPPVIHLDAETMERLIPPLFHNTDSVFRIKSALYLLTDAVIKNVRPVADKLQQTDLAHRIITYMQDNFTEDISLKTMADALGYHRLYLSRYINEHLKQSFTDFLYDYRINFSIYLMQYTGASISDAALTCGFNTLRTFNRAFKEVTGTTPREYLKSHQ